MSNYPTLRNATVAGLIGIVLGIVVLRLAGVSMPAVPPGAVVCLVAAAFLAFAPWRWVPILAIVAALFEAVPATTGLGSFIGDGALDAAGAIIRFVGMAVALIGGILATIASFKRAKTNA
ncbi:hypothetical protein [Actinophytocola sp.]|jgi:uncharacterized membrane protein|uniref:hypothetical protein n=1 Tax=Actinophytocola sp. TaxID=1872138 RepID=UPI002ED9A69D